ncbi:hypothetical protein FRC08_013783 [Ceratobasidium sp. 394]|nr:hypothetical protein FRC08_013783 [Ceratobasidium sp. 394]
MDVDAGPHGDLDNAWEENVREERAEDELFGHTRRGPHPPASPTLSASAATYTPITRAQHPPVQPYDTEAIHIPPQGVPACVRHGRRLSASGLWPPMSVVWGTEPTAWPRYGRISLPQARLRHVLPSACCPWEAIPRFGGESSSRFGDPATHVPPSAPLASPSLAGG